MDGWFEFIIERYNYWIVIVLMMTGLYTVFARGNLVKKVVGLNLFQTSVFIFYITIGKVAGGTAPIYIGGELDHGKGYGDGHDKGAGKSDGYGEGAAHGAEATGGLHDAPSAQSLAEAGLHDKIDNTLPDNDLKAALDALEPGSGSEGVASLHEAPEGADKISNDTFADLAKPEPTGDAHAFEVEGLHEGAGNALGEVGAHAEIIYSNPLPHVLILTAIVVGVATTAVGLALAVRVREAYGTIEEDELAAIDDLAEFGETAEAGGAA